MAEMAKFAADIMKDNPSSFRVFGPDETKSNRMFALFNVTNRQ
jgi:hypothetical protein